MSRGGAVKWRRSAGALALLLLAFALLLAGAGTTGTGPMPVAAQDEPTTTIDYDLDDDGLIEVRNLAQLNAIRWDLGGNGSSVSAENRYDQAFPNRALIEWAGITVVTAPMGCGREAHPTIPGWCIGYELANDLNFDTNGDDEITAADGVLSYGAAGAGWDPIGDVINFYAGRFEGNGYTISNMMINSDDTRALGLFASGNDAQFTGVGMRDVDIRATHDGAGGIGYYVGGLVGRLFAGNYHGGAVRNSYVTGKITVTSTGSATARAGGLVGRAQSGATIAGSWANVEVTSESTVAGNGDNVGGLVGYIGQQIEPNRNSVTASYAAGNVKAQKGSSFIGGLIGLSQNTTVTASYATGRPENTGDPPLASVEVGGLIGLSSNNTTTSASYWDRDTSSIAGAGSQSTGDLKRLTGYTGIYAGWNVDVDNADGDNNPATGVDDPWDFGTAAQYPALKGPVVARGDDLTVFSGAEVTLKAGLVRDIRGNLETVSVAGATYAWRQVGGDAVTLSAADAAEPHLHCPHRPGGSHHANLCRHHNPDRRRCRHRPGAGNHQPGAAQRANQHDGNRRRQPAPPDAALRQQPPQL